MKVETAKRIKILIELSYLKKFEGNQSEFARKIKLKTSADPDFNQIFTLLREKGIIVKVKGSVSSWDKYYVEVKKLCSFIEELGIVKKVREYIAYPH